MDTNRTRALAELVAEITTDGRRFSDCEWRGSSGGGGRYVRQRGTTEFKNDVAIGVRIVAHHGPVMFDCRIAPPVSLAEFATALEAAGCKFNDTP